MKTYQRVLTIAGSDSGGGAGIQADIKAISACGCYAASAITALTAQNTLGVFGIHPVPIDFIALQIDLVLSDIGADAIKIGMLHSSDVVRVVAQAIRKFGITNVVVDPVMVATSGDKLLKDEAIATLRNELLPLARVITPNIPEAELLLGKKLNDSNELPQFAKELSMNGTVSVLLKAGHLQNDLLEDVLYNVETDELLTFSAHRIDTPNTHGTGCTLSSALAAFLAKGYSLNEATQRAKNYITKAIELGAAYKLGGGHGPVSHFGELWGEK